MAQSSYEYGMRRVPAPWQNYTIEPPIPWDDWSDMFQLALIAKENVEIENLINSSDRSIATPATFEETPESENAQDKAARQARNLEEKQRYEDEEKALIKSELKKRMKSWDKRSG